MPFRDRAPLCPRCRVTLTRADDERDAWSCPRCEGVALGVGDLIDDLLAVAPHLRPPHGVRDVVTVPRRAAAEHPCPTCARPMEPSYLAAVEVERCRDDGLVWLDRGGRAAIIERARAQRAPGLLAYLRELLLGPRRLRVRAPS